MTFASYLAALDDLRLAEILQRRPDACTEPVPRTIHRLADRLGHPASVSQAMLTLDQDAVQASRAITVLGPAATPAAIAEALSSPRHLVDAALERLTSTALAWPDGTGSYLTIDVLAEHWRNELDLGVPAGTLLPKLTVDVLRTAARGLGVAATGLRKNELLDAVTDAMADTALVSRTAAALPGPARELLSDLLAGPRSVPRTPAWAHTPRTEPVDALVTAGLVLPIGPGRLEIPAEIVAALRRWQGRPLTGAPEPAPATAALADVDRAAVAAAGSALATLTALLDDARDTPIAALRSGGVGARERKRLAGRLDRDDNEITLWLDVAFDAGLLAAGERGYLPTPAYDEWRAQPPARRFHTALLSWFGLPHAPSHRRIDEQRSAPPLPLESPDGLLRRTLLRACADERPSVGAVARAVRWWCPMIDYPDDVLVAHAETALAEAERLGVVALDSLSTVGAALSTGDRLAAALEELLPAADYRVALQSDLTATVLGEPPAAVVSLLNSVAMLEARGSAQIWRFSPDSVRAGLDAGVTVTTLREKLAKLGEHGIPQPLDYLLADVARRYGSVTVSAALSCIRADEAQIAELLADRSLRPLGFLRLAPTVLSSPKPLTEVLAALRDAGHAPVAEDTAGNRMTNTRRQNRAQSAARRSAGRGVLSPHEVVARLRAAEDEPEVSAVAKAITEHNTTLTPDEIAILADAIDGSGAVSISYRANSGSVTRRTISELAVDDAWIEAWCHLRNAERVFTVSHILAVIPA